jgi:hypothetical protein
MFSKTVAALTDLPELQRALHVAIGLARLGIFSLL